MHQNIKLGIKSLIAGGLTGLIAIGTSALLDNYMKSTLSNFIGLLIAMCFNFIWQQFIFVGKIKTIGGLFLLKYILTDIIILGSGQLLFILAMKYKKQLNKNISKKYKKYYNSFMRTVIASIIWLIFSFPLRRYWIFI